MMNFTTYYKAVTYVIDFILANLNGYEKILNLNPYKNQNFIYLLKRSVD